jgi:hypothetical protein
MLKKQGIFPNLFFWYNTGNFGVYVAGQEKGGKSIA